MPSKWDFKIAGVQVVVVVAKDPLMVHGSVLMCRNDSMLGYAEGLAWDVVNEGGNIIRDETDVYVANYGEIKAGECVVSGAGRLGYKHIVHGVVESSEHVDKAVRNTLKLAEKLKAPTLLIPTPCADFAATAAAIREYFKDKDKPDDTSLLTISVVVPSEPAGPGPAPAPAAAPSIQYTTAEITDAAPEDGKGCIIAHFVTNGPWTSKGCMGKLTKAFGKAPSAPFASTHPKPLGSAEIHKVKPGLYIYSLVTLQTPAGGQGPALSVDHFPKVLSFLAKKAAEHSCSVHIYRPPDSAIPNLNWSKAHRLIATLFKDINVCVHTTTKQDLTKYKKRAREDDEESDQGKKKQKTEGI
eukprot:TRINITY_DN1010_c1_g1_i1.p1 TRINITY_DN1010_c1_g1~~TRINITY_DN1010_c1_g1_i1.p1  ORF type:complete len:367 (+),score=88.52 TRINITY_DN1010_c1_g1_i1:37-1101(+)